MYIKSQITTTVEQSHRLLKLGVKPETADCHYLRLVSGRFHHAVTAWRGGHEDLPAWSLHRLIAMIADSEEGIRTTIEADGIYDRMIDWIESAIINGYFNPEYINK